MQQRIDSPVLKAGHSIELFKQDGLPVRLQKGESHKVAVKANEKFNLKKISADAIGNDMIALKEGDALVLQYADGTRLCLEGFYASPDAAVELSLGEGMSHTICSADAGTLLSAGSVFVYSHGDQTALMGMASGDASLQTAISKHINLSGLPQYAEAATGTATDAAAGAAVSGSGAEGGIFAEMSTMSAAGLGILAVGGGIAIAAGGGGDSGDTTPPSATASIDAVTDDAGNITGILSSGSVTDDTSLSLSGAIEGALESGDVVAVYDGTTRLGTATVEEGRWNYTDSTLTGGDTPVYTVRVEDAAGNHSTASGSVSVTIDTTAPAFSSAASVSVEENMTSAVYTATATGAAVYSLGGTDAALFDINPATGVVTFKTSPDFEAPADAGGNNVYNITVTATDAAGNAASQNVAITVVNVDVTINTVASDNIINAAEKASGVTLTGNNEPDVGVTVNGNTAVVSGTSWSHTLDTAAIEAMGEGGQTLTIVSGGTTITKEITVDTTIATPTVALTNDTANASDGITSDASLTLSPAVADVTRTYTVNGGIPTNTYTAPTTDDNYTVIVNDVDTAGNTASATISFTLDTSAPAFTSGTAVNVSENTTSTIYTASATGAAAYSLSGTDAALFNIDSETGAVSFKTGPDFENPSDNGVNNVYDITVTATDAAGNAASQNVAITVVNVDVTINTVASDNIINAAEKASGVTLTGNNEPDVGVTVNGNTAVVSGTSWSHTLDTAAIEAMGEGGQTLTIVSGGTTITKEITVDTITPTATIVLSDYALKVGNTATVTVTFSEAVADFSNGDVTAQNGTLSTFTTTDNIVWTATFTPTTPIDVATNVITLADSYTDSALNPGTAASSGNYTIDTIAPSAPSSLNLADNDDTGVSATDNITSNNTNLTFNGTGETGATVSLFIDEDSNGTISSPDTWLGTATVTDGTWTVEFGGDSTWLEDGTHDIYAYQTDAAGNDSAPSAKLSLTVDTVAPTLTLPTSPADNAASVPTTSNIVLTFSENVVIGSDVDDAVILTDATDNSGTRNIYTTSGEIGITNNVATVNPASDMDPSTNYNVTITEGTFTDVAGNPYAGFTDTTSLNFTTATPDTEAPYIVNAQFTKGATTTLTMVFSEPVVEGSATPTFWLNGTTELTPSSSNISGDTVTVTFAVATTSNDVIMVNAPDNSLRDSAGNASSAVTLFAGSSDNSTMELNTLDLSEADHLRGIFGGDGDDTITATKNQDFIFGGEGSDTISSQWGEDVIYLTETTPARDTVMISNPDGEPNSSLNSFPYNVDIVFDFDASSTTTANHDVLGVEIVDIATNGSYGSGTFNVTSGIATFSSVSNASNIENRVSTLDASLTANDTVGIRYDSDNSGSADSLLVFQKSDAQDEDPSALIALVEMANIGSVTLGTAAGPNVVQIVDKVGPEIDNLAFIDNHRFSLTFNEIVATTDLGTANSEFRIGTGATLGAAFEAAGISGTGTVTLTIDTGIHTFTTSQYLLMSVSGDPTITDTAGNVTTLFDRGENGVALGNTSTASIDLRSLSGNYSIVNFLSSADSTLYGTSGNGWIEGGIGNDTITGGRGADDMYGGGGSDTFVFAQGDSTAVVYHNENGGGLNDSDTFTFADGCDIIDLWDMESGDAMTVLLNGLTGSEAADGSVGDQKYQLIEGWFDWDSNAFGVSTSGWGNATLVLYDGTAGGGVSQTALIIAGTTPDELTAGIDTLLYSVIG